MFPNVNLYSLIPAAVNEPLQNISIQKYCQVTVEALPPSAKILVVGTLHLAGQQPFRQSYLVRKDI